MVQYYLLRADYTVKGGGGAQVKPRQDDAHLTDGFIGMNPVPKLISDVQ